MKIAVAGLFGVFLFGVTNFIRTSPSPEPLVEMNLAQAATVKTDESSKPLSEIQFRVTDTSFVKARLFPEKVEDIVVPWPGSCQVVDGGKLVEGKFRLEFEIKGSRIAEYFLDLSFAEGHLWEPRLKKSNLPLIGQSKEQIVIVQYRTCNSVAAMIFGYDLQAKSIVRYSFSDDEHWQVSLSMGTKSFPDGRVQVLEQGKPAGVFQKLIYNNAVWGTFLDRYLFDLPTYSFLKIPMVVGMRVHPEIPPGGRAEGREILLYEDGYMADLVSREKFVSKLDVYKLLDSQEVKGVLGLRAKSGRRLEMDFFDGDWPIHDFFFSINNRTFSARCGQNRCPRQIQSIKEKLLQFWK
jgi:hypothetical protein